MTHPSEPDLGALTWVKGEIDAALERSAAALAQAHGTDAGAHLQFAQTHLHQVRGALSMISLDGLARFTELAEQLLGDMARGELPADTGTLALGTRAVAAIGNYLEELAHGAPDQPLRLSPLYRELAGARGATRAGAPGSAAEAPDAVRPDAVRPDAFHPDAFHPDLFHPDLSRRPPRRADSAPPADADTSRSALRNARARFERGLLDWLRGAGGRQGAQAMRDAIADVEALQPTPASRSLWWASLAFFDALIVGSLPPDATVKRLCTQLDAQFRRLMSGTPAGAERLLRDLLYRVATTPADTPQQHAVRACWQLDALLPEADARVSDTPLVPLLDGLQARLATVREHWDEFSRGTAVALADFDEQLGALAGDAAALGRPALQRLLASLLDFGRWLRRDPLQFSDALALEVASALLLVETALERRPPDVAFAAQVDAVCARLDALQRSEALPSAAAAPHADGARQAQEKAALAQLSKEMLASLAQVEQTLDDYFRNHAKRAPLAQLQRPLQQLSGALEVLGEADALALVRDAARRIAAFADTATAPDPAACEALAHQLSALGFHLEALPRGGSTLQHFLRMGARGAPAAADTAPAVGAAPATAAGGTSAPEVPPPEQPVLEGPVLDASIPEAWVPEALVPEASVLEALVPERAAAERSPAQASAPELSAPQAPAADAATDAVREAATAGAPAAPRVAPDARPAGEAIELVDRADAFGPADDSDEITLEEDVEEISLEAEETPALAPAPPLPATAAAVDAELLAIFIEEATDVLATIRERLELARTEPAEAEHLSTIRRGFHTLKGSGRMVGLADIGEAAWGLEQTLNRWLQLDWPVTPALLHLVDAAQQRFATWVAQLAAGGPQAFDVGAVLAEAERMRQTDTPALEPAPLAEHEAAAPIPAPLPAAADAFEFPPLDLSAEGEILPFGETAAAPRAETMPETEAEAETGSAAGTEAEAEAASEADAVGEAEVEGEVEADADADADADAEFSVEDKTRIETGVGAGVDAEVEAEAAAASEPDLLRIGGVEISRALYALYCAEAAEHLATLAREFAPLTHEAGRPPSERALRAAHTLAGVSGTAGFLPPHELGRALEHAIERLRAQSRAPDAAERTLFASAADALRAMLAEIGAARLPSAAHALVAELDRRCRDLAAGAGVGSEDAAAASLAPADSAAVAPASTAAPVLAAPPRDDIDPQLLPIFLDEAAEQLGRLHATLRGWQAAPDDTEPARAVARLLHSLKGSARMAGAMTLGGHLHQLESRLEDGLADRIDIAALIDDLAFGLDVCERMIDGLASGETAPGAVLAAGTAAAPAPAGTAEADAGAATLRVRAELIDRFVSQAGEVGIARTRIEGELRTLRRSLLDLTENVIRLRSQLREVEIQADVQMQSRLAEAESRHTAFDPLEMDRYTRLQELTRMMAESVNDVTTVQQTVLHNLDGADLALNGQARMARELQQGLMQVRMLPFDSLADRLYRVVRQSAKELGKRAALDLRGGRLEIDRSVLEQMAVPLEHLLRNALAHGIEAPAARAAAGKPDSGRITLTLTQEGNEIALELADDGAGLDFERIAAQARAAGLLAADEAADTHRLTGLIFLPGFSTAGAVSAVSGRGVGMDVVRAQTAAAGGRIEVASEPGHGTTFRIHLPLKLAVTQALLVRAGGRSWAIPSNMVAQAMELKPEALRRVQAERGLDWEGEHYAYRYLPRLLGDRAARPEEQRYNWLLLLRAGAQRLALHVDGLRGNQEIVIKNAGPQLARIVGMSAATVLGDGEIVLILNPLALAGRSPEADADADEGGAVGTAAEHVPTVLVVDDSLTVRKITGRLLEREGYRVLTAKDGVDALEQLIDTVPDVVLADIEMPRMDGFDLVRNIRADARTRALPVIMITSRLAEKHRRHAHEVGADHYLGKPYQEAELLALVAGYSGRSARTAAASAALAG